MDNDEVSIDLSIDTKEVEETIELIAASFQRIQASIDRIGDKIAKSLLSVTTAIQGLEKGNASIFDFSLDNITKQMYNFLCKNKFKEKNNEKVF